jgi:uncharacterized protein
MARILLMLCAVAVFAYCAGNVIQKPPLRRALEADDYIWKTFAECKVSTDPNFSYNINYTREVKEMNGKEITASGFMVPLVAKERPGHFLLSKRAPTCAFCPPGEPNEVLEVFTGKPMAWTENLVTLSGTLVLPGNGKRSIFFQLKDAEGP